MAAVEGIAGADALLGRPFPLPSVPLPLTRWVEVRAVGKGAEVEWNLDDSRPDTPGRLALYAGLAVEPSQLSPQATETRTPEGWTVRSEPLDAAQESLRPVIEVMWNIAEVHLRLTGQGPWTLDQILVIARSVAV